MPYVCDGPESAAPLSLCRVWCAENARCIADLEAWCWVVNNVRNRPPGTPIGESAPGSLGEISLYAVERMRGIIDVSKPSGKSE